MGSYLTVATTLPKADGFCVFRCLSGKHKYIYSMRPLRLCGEQSFAKQHRKQWPVAPSWAAQKDGLDMSRIDIFSHQRCNGAHVCFQGIGVSTTHFGGDFISNVQ